MAYSKAQKEATARYRAKVGRTTANIDLRPADRDAWKAYAASKGLTLPGMVRACVDRCMQLDNFAQLVPDAADIDKAEKQDTL